MKVSTLQNKNLNNQINFIDTLTYETFICRQKIMILVVLFPCTPSWVFSYPRLYVNKTLKDRA